MPEAGPGQSGPREAVAPRDVAPAHNAVVAHDAVPAGAVAPRDVVVARDAARRPPTRWFFYGLGLSLQTLLWFLLFLAITVAVLVGGKLTEFRYVGF